MYCSWNTTLYTEHNTNQTTINELPYDQSAPLLNGIYQHIWVNSFNTKYLQWTVFFGFCFLKLSVVLKWQRSCRVSLTLPWLVFSCEVIDWPSKKNTFKFYIKFKWIKKFKVFKCWMTLYKLATWGNSAKTTEPITTKLLYIFRTIWGWFYLWHTGLGTHEPLKYPRVATPGDGSLWI